MGEYIEDMLDNNELDQEFLDSLDDDLLLRELIQREMEAENESLEDDI